jgi:medium-chain acyl-[acyl-carrier-protein] hydrolase
LIFRGWASGLPADVEVCAVQLPGRGTRLTERPFTRLAPLVEALAEALVPLLNMPFAFFGHSLGSLISFELARHLRKAYGVQPVRLFVSAAPAPQIPRRCAPVHALPEKEFLAELRQLKGTPTEILEHKELMAIMLPLLRADFAVYETYEYRAETPLTCPISAFGGLDDRRVIEGDLEAWRIHTDGFFSLRMFDGDHFFLNQPLFLREFSKELERKS